MVPSGRWLRPGQRSVSRAPMSFWSGSSALPGRLNRGRRQSTAVTVRPAVLTCVFPGPQQLTATDLAGAGATCQIQARGPRVKPPGGPPSPQVGSVMMRCLRPAPSMTRRWPPTRSACRPAIRFRNVGSPDVRTYIPPLGASENRRCTTSTTAPRPAGYPGHGLIAGCDQGTCAQVLRLTAAQADTSLMPGDADLLAADGLGPDLLRDFVRLGTGYLLIFGRVRPRWRRNLWPARRARTTGRGLWDS
jgi:hypothetical protein